MLSETTVPIFVDSIKNGMTRFTYLYLDCSEPHLATISPNDNLSSPVIIIDLEAIIISGLNGEPFYEPMTIKELFYFIDESNKYVISTGYFWLNNSIIKMFIDQKLTSKHVLRIQADLFLFAVKKYSDNIDDFFQWLTPSHTDRLLAISEEETIAFREWTDLTINRAKDLHQNKIEQKRTLRTKGV
jgi:hypothetical protein